MEANSRGDPVRGFYGKLIFLLRLNEATCHLIQKIPILNGEFLSSYYGSFCVMNYLKLLTILNITCGKFRLCFANYCCVFYFPSDQSQEMIAVLSRRHVSREKDDKVLFCNFSTYQLVVVFIQYVVIMYPPYFLYVLYFT